MPLDTPPGPPSGFGAVHEWPQPGAEHDEWVFTAWRPDASLGVVSAHRLVRGTAWYWSALVRDGRPLLHLAEWAVTVRADPFVVKAPEMWAEHHCDAPLEQWSVGNEAYFTALDVADDALGRGYGVPTPTAMDLEWYATGEPVAVADGFTQEGVVHGAIEVAGDATEHLAEVPARRWRRWTSNGTLAPVPVAPVTAHTGVRAPFAFPDGTVADWVLTPSGWARRRAR